MTRKSQDPRPVDPRVVGKAYINCPTGGELLEVEVRLQSIEEQGQGSFYFNFKQTYDRHECKGRFNDGES